MGYADKLQKLCAMRGIDQSRLAERLGLSKSTMSRIMSGLQEPKLRLALQLAKTLGVSLDFLADDEQESEPSGNLVRLSEEEIALLKIISRLGPETSIQRLLLVDPTGGRSDGTRDVPLTGPIASFSGRRYDDRGESHG